jgi:hypothetical protein
MKAIKPQAGMVNPHEYDWIKEFNQLDTLKPFTEMDTGKVVGLAYQYYFLLDVVAGLQTHIDELEAKLEKEIK